MLRNGSVGTSSRTDAAVALAALRAALRKPPADGPNYDAEAARDAATEILRGLPPSDDTFLVECLEQAAVALCGDGGEDEDAVCEAVINAMRGRDCPGADGVLHRLAMHEGQAGQWLPGWLVQVLRKWDARRFEPTLRCAALRHPSDFVRACAAEMLVACGLATPTETDAFLSDRSESVQRLTARGLATLGTPDAIRRLAEVVFSGPDRWGDRRRSQQANSLLRCLGLVPARGGEC